MAVNVTGGEDGALDFTAGIDLGNFDAGLSQMEAKISKTYQTATTEADKFQKALAESTKGFGANLDPKIVQDWSVEILKAKDNIQNLLSKGAASLDPGKLIELKNQISGATGEFDELGRTIQFIKENIGSLNLNPEDTKILADSIKQIETTFDGFTDKTVKARTRLTELKNALAEAGDKGGPAIDGLREEAAHLTDTLDSNNKAIKLLSSNTSGLQAGVSAFRGVVAGFEAIAGAVGLASSKSEEMEGVISSIIAAMGVLNGVQEVAEVLDKRSALNQYLLLQYRKLAVAETATQAGVTGVLAGAQAAETAATEAGAIAQTELNAAMSVNPAFVLLTAISALAAGIYYLTQKNHEADEAATKLNKTLLDQYNVSREIYELSKFSFEQNVASQEAGLEGARAANESQKELLQRQIEIDKLKQDQAKKDLQKAKDDLTGANSLSKAIADQFNQISKLQGIKSKPIDLGFENTTDVDSLIKKLETLDNKIVALKNSSHADKNKTQIEALSAQVDQLKPKVQAYIDSILKLGTATSKTKNDQTTQDTEEYEKGIKSFTAFQQAKTLALGKSQQDQLALTLASIKAQTAAQLDPKLNPELTSGEAVKIQAQSLKDQAEAVFNANQKEYADKVKLLNAEASLYKEGTKERLRYDLDALEVEKTAQLQQQVQLNGQTIQFRKLSQDQINTITDTYLAAVKQKNESFYKQLSADQISAQISENNARLATVEAGSVAELKIKKELIDEQAALDTLNANTQIVNEQFLAAKVLEIHAKSVADKKKLDDQYVQTYLDNQFRIIDSENNKSKKANNIILADPNSSATQIGQAKISNLQKDADALKAKINEVNVAIFAGIATGNGDFKKLIKEREDLSKQLDDVNNGVAKNKKGLSDSQKDKDIKYLNAVGGAISSLGNNLEQYNLQLGGIFVSLGNIAKSAATILKLSKSDTDEFQKISSGLEAAVSLITTVVSASAQRAQAEAQFNADLLHQQEEYNLALNENILLNQKLKDNVFTQDFADQLKDGTEALVDAREKYKESIDALTAGQVKEGQRTAISGSAILGGIGSGAVLGAAIGSAVPVIGNIVGTVVGGIVGGIVGLFSGPKEDKYVSLLKEYPELIQKAANGQVEINKALAQSLLNSDLLDSSTKVLVQNTLDWQEAIDKANEQIRSIISDMAGDLGSNLSSSLVQAFEDGTDAAEAFAGSVQKTLEKILENFLFNQVFGKAFDQLQAQMTASFAQGGDFDWSDDIEAFFNQYKDLTTEFDQALQDAKDQAKTAGLDIFQTSQDANSNSGNSLKGAIKGITEQTAELLAGQFGGLRITALDQLKVGQQQLTALNEIVSNTAMIQNTNTILKDFQLNGIKVK